MSGHAEGTKGGRTEESLASSLNALRAIEHERVADERAAVEAALQAKQRAREAAESKTREIEAGRIAAERAAQLAAERARAEAEHQEQLRLSAAEAVERARRLVALDEKRLDEELALRRVIALRTRPRWMIAVTCMAMIAALAAGWVALEARGDMAAAIEDRNHAIDARTSAQAQARESEAATDRLTHEISELEAKIEAAIRRGITDQGDADRRRSLDQLRRLQRQRAEIVARQRQAEQDRRNNERRAPLVVPATCRNNAICQ
jgi:hypothetical protein